MQKAPIFLFFNFFLKITFHHLAQTSNPKLKNAVFINLNVSYGAVEIGFGVKLITTKRFFSLLRRKCSAETHTQKTPRSSPAKSLFVGLSPPKIEFFASNYPDFKSPKIKV